MIEVKGREIPVRAVFTRSERLKDAVDRAYREKYNTPPSVAIESCETSMRGYHRLPSRVELQT